MADTSFLDLAWSSPVDEDEALRRIGGDKEVLVDVIGAFLETYVESMNDIQRAVRSGGEDLSFTVHRFKGALAQLAAHPALDAARKLEDAAVSRPGDIESHFAVLRFETDRLAPALRRLASRLS